MKLFKQLPKLRTSFCQLSQTTFGKCVIKRQMCGTTTSTTDLNLIINGINVKNYINKLEQEHLLKRNTADNWQSKKFETVMSVLQQRKEQIDLIKNLEELLQDKDKDIQKMAVEEKKVFVNKIKEIDKELEGAILNLHSSEDNNAILLEINSGVGGQEAMLFASELFNMYSGFIEYKNWTCDIAEYLTTDLGGIRHASLLVNGRNVYKYFQHEAGVHRVQRIPSTEKSGRVHTSTASVLALPQPTDIDINLQATDLRIDTKRASGAGGQHVNTTDSAVRITHLPTGIAVECQTNRSQIKNREIAMQHLKAKLYDIELQKQQNEISKTKKSQVKSNFRNEKIRTYNFSQDRITDHRLQGSNMHNLKYFMQGNELLETLINKLDYQFKVNNLMEIINSINK